MERELVYDIRNPEQRQNEPENSKLISLQEVIDMTKEAEENGVGHIKRMWHNDLEEEYPGRQPEGEREEKEEDQRETRQFRNVIIRDLNEYVFSNNGKIEFLDLIDSVEKNQSPYPTLSKNITTYSNTNTAFND